MLQKRDKKTLLNGFQLTILASFITSLTPLAFFFILPTILFSPSRNVNISKTTIFFIRTSFCFVFLNPSFCDSIQFIFRFLCLSLFLALYLFLFKKKTQYPPQNFQHLEKSQKSGKKRYKMPLLRRPPRKKKPTIEEEITSLPPSEVPSERLIGVDDTNVNAVRCLNW